jgi:hypothetical protein
MSSWEASGKSDEWYTPRYVFDALGCRFDLYPAGPQTGGHVPATVTYFGAGGLEKDWYGFVWMNPPFGGRNGIAPWLAKFFRHGDGIALTPDRTSAPWFQEYAPKASALLFVAPKIKFERPDGSVGRSPGCGAVLMAAGPRGRAILFRAGRLGLVALPNLGAEMQAAA